MNLNRKNIGFLKKMPIKNKREFIKDLMIQDNLSFNIYTVSDKQVNEAFDKILNTALEEIKNGSK